MVRVGNVMVTMRCCLSERWYGTCPQVNIAILLLGIIQNLSFSMNSCPNVSTNLERGSSITQVTLEKQDIVFTLHPEPPVNSLTCASLLNKSWAAVLRCWSLLLSFFYSLWLWKTIHSFSSENMYYKPKYCIVNCIFFSLIEKINSILSTFLQKSHFLNLLSLTFSRAYLYPPWSPDLITLSETSMLPTKILTTSHV